MEYAETPETKISSAYCRPKKDDELNVFTRKLSPMFPRAVRDWVPLFTVYPLCIPSG